MRKHLRNLLVLVVMVVCVAATIHLFDWQNVMQTIRRMHVGILVAGGLPILLAIFALRGLRWLVVLGITPTASRLWQSFCANGAAAGLASLTPFQLGEVIKVRLIPDQHGDAWRLGVSGFFVERVMDLGTLLSVGLCGLAIHAGFAWLAPLALLLPVLGGFVLALLSTHVRRLPLRMQPYLEAFHHARRIILTSVLTIPIWLLYVCLWWVAARALNVHLDFGEATILLGGVTLAVVASMAPGGAGVSELGSRGIMLWLGASMIDAEATAVALRMLTPLIVGAGLICLLALLYHRHRMPPASIDLPLRQGALGKRLDSPE